MRNLKQLKQEFGLFHDGDSWGTVMHWWFSIADEIHFNRPKLTVPDAWKFRPSPMGPTNEPDDYLAAILADTDDTSLAAFGDILHRYARILRHKGLSY